jgi:uncharacterized protein YdeI (YjbR/CyaY-like superfamily)
MKSKPNPEVDWYFNEAKNWREELEVLRVIVLDSQLTEELKWGVPTYTLDNSNIVLIHVFKAYCALLFFKGALLKDPNGILIQQTKNVQSARQIRFTDAREIRGLRPVIKAYLAEAIEVEKSGLVVVLKPTTEFGVPEELQDQFDEIPEFKTAFEALTPGGSGVICFIFRSPSNPKPESRGLKTQCRRFLMGRAWMIVDGSCSAGAARAFGLNQWFSLACGLKYF